MKQTLTRRLLAAAAGLAVGVVGIVAFATPASATGENNPARYGKETGLTGLADCDLETETWTVTWTVSNPSPFVQATINALSAEVDGFAVDDVVPAEASLTGTQTFPSGTGSASLTVELKWAWEVWGHWKSVTDDATETVPLGECAEEEPPPTTPPPTEEPPTEEPAGFVDPEFDCDVFTLTISNDTEEEVTLTVVPSEGDPVDVTIVGGETSEVEIPSAEGLTVDLQVEGESVLEGEPFEITSEDWADLGCDEGEGGELPTTGASTGLIALGAVALLALGGGLFLVARRRRITFTA